MSITNNSSEAIADNLNRLMKDRKISRKDLSAKCGGKPSPRYLANILNQEYAPTIVMIDALADAFNLKSWHLLMPDLDIEVAKKEMPLLLDNYKKSSAEGREYIMRIADKESKYGS